MKKIINSAIMVTAATILFSCQKQKDLTAQDQETNAAQTKSNKTAQPSPEKVPFTLSEWILVDLNPDKDGGLTGTNILNSPLPGTNDTDVKLAYVRRNVEGTGISSDAFSYYLLPADFYTSHGHPVQMSFELGTTLFEIFIIPSGSRGIQIDPYDFKDCAYRYIVISQQDYTGLHVDWSDYRAVARIFNFTP